MSKISSILNDLGLSAHESNVYVALLEMGGADATALAEKTGLKRTTTYPILERLIAQGVVSSYDQGSKKFFKPLPPAQLGSLYQKKLNSLSSIIPLLENLQGQQTDTYGVRLIQSKKELETFYGEILEEYKNKEYYIIGSAPGFLNIDRDFLLNFRKKRAAGNTRVKLLLTHDSRQEEGQGDPKLLREFKYLPEKYIFKSTIDIYDDKIVIVGPEVKAVAVVIAIPPMVGIFRAVFEALWETTK